VGSLIASQGADDAVRASFAVLGQCRTQQATPDPSPPRLRPHVEVDSCARATLDPATVEPDGLVPAVGDEEDGGGLAGTPIGQLVEGADVGTRLGVPGTRLLHAQRPPQARQLPEVVLPRGSHDDVVSALAHTVEGTRPTDDSEEEQGMRWEYKGEMVLFEETEEGLVPRLDWLEEASSQGWELASTVPLIAPNRDGVAYGTVGLFAILKRSREGAEPT
jgi:hypothetical protein